MADEPNQNEEPVDERPAWLPDNFKTPEDFVKSYHEAQGRVSQLSEKQQELETTLNAVLEAQEQAKQPPVEEPAFDQDQWLDAFNQNPLGVIAHLAGQVADQKLQGFRQQQTQTLDPHLNATDEMAAELANNALAARYDDWGTPENPGYSARVAELIQRDPSLLPVEVVHSPQKLVAKLDQIYKIAKAEDLMAGNTQIQDAFAESRQQKLAAQTAPGTTGRPEATTESDQDFAKSLLEAHNLSYAARMARAGL